MPASTARGRRVPGLWRPGSAVTDGGQSRRLVRARPRPGGRGRGRGPGRPPGPGSGRDPVQPRPPRTATSPVNLATPVDMADGLAHPSAIVRVGRRPDRGAQPDAAAPRVLTLGALREQPRPSTPSIVGCRCRSTRARVSGGWLTLRTSQATLRYQVGSGPFTAANTSVRFADGTRDDTVHPTWDWECPFDQTCQAGRRRPRRRGRPRLRARADTRAAPATWATSSTLVPAPPGTSSGAPAGPAVLSIRYSNVAGPLHAPARPAPST